MRKRGEKALQELLSKVRKATPEEEAEIEKWFKDSESDPDCVRIASSHDRYVSIYVDYSKSKSCPTYTIYSQKAPNKPIAVFTSKQFKEIVKEGAWIIERNNQALEMERKLKKK